MEILAVTRRTLRLGPDWSDYRGCGYWDRFVRLSVNQELALSARTVTLSDTSRPIECAFVALSVIAVLVGALLGRHGVPEDKLTIGCVIPAALFIGVQLKTGRLLIGRNWDITLATKDESPRLFWTVVCVEVGLCVLGIYGLPAGGAEKSRTQE